MLPLYFIIRKNVRSVQFLQVSLQASLLAGLDFFRFRFGFDDSAFTQDQLLEFSHLLPSNSPNRHETGDDFESQKS